jgi:hypothetical protein
MSKEKIIKIVKYSIIPLVLSASFFILSYGSTQNLSGTIDEKFHLTRGILLLDTGDLRINQHHPILFNVLYSIPTLFDEDLEKPSTESEFWETAHKDQLSFELVDVNGGLVEYSSNVLPGPRLVAATVSSIFIVLFYFIVLKLFSFNTALISTTLLAFSPTFIAHGSLVTTDVPAAITIFLATICLYYYILRRDLGDKILFWKFSKRDVLFLLFILLGFIALITKYTAVIIAPVWILFTYLDGFLGRSSKEKLYKRILLPLVKIAIVAAAWFLLILASYQFKFGTLEDMTYGLGWKIATSQDIHDEIDRNFGTDSLPSKLWGYFYYELQFPFPHYVHGFYDNVFVHDKFGHSSYLFGEFRDQGWWYYFPASFSLKESLPTVLLTSMTIIAGIVIAIKERSKLSLGYGLLLSIPTILLFLSMTSSLNLGIRHILPILPFVFLFIGLVSSYIVNRYKAFWFILGIFGAFGIVSVLSQYPNYIGYFNESIESPKEGYKYLRSSDFDWEQNEILVANYIEENNLSLTDEGVLRRGDGVIIIRKVILYNEPDYEYSPQIKALREAYEQGEIVLIDEIGATHLVLEDKLGE